MATKPKAQKSLLSATSRVLIDAVKDVLTARDTESVLKSILNSSCELLNAEAASIFFVDRKKRRLQMALATNLSKKVAREISVPIGHGVSGWVAQKNKTVRIDDMSKDDRFFRNVDQKTGFQTKGYICVPLTVEGKVIGTLQVLNQQSGGKFGERDQAVLEAFALIAALALNNTRLRESELEKKRMQGEMETAQAFQQRLIPQQFDPPEGLDVATFYKPARQMGGDTYDAIHAPDGGYIVLIGDVTGKGPGAALWMSGFATLINFIEEQGLDPLLEMEKIDRHLFNIMPMTTFITMFLAKIHEDHLHYLSAGHNSMLLMHADGRAEWLESTGLPLGTMPDMPKEQVEVAFPSGSVLVMFSDGVTEAENKEGEMYEEERLAAIVRKHIDKPAQHLVDSIARSIASFTRGAEQSDDITMMVVKRS